MAGKHKFTRAYKGLDIQKANELNPIPGILGFIINGNRTVEVPNRNGYVYVRLRDNLSEVCQAFNDNVSPVYGLPVLMVRDSTNRTRYKILGRDLGRYQDWGTSSPYLPRHGAQHSFNPPNEGGDVTWIYSRQLMPLSVYPSGSYGAGNVLIYPHTFYRNNTWHYAGGTGTASFLPYKPTGSSARMVLLYIDDNDAPAYVAGSFFSASLTGTVQIFPYIPSLPITSGIPLAGIRLVSGTSVILWDNIYDLRPWIVGDSFIPTGSYGHTIADEGVSLPNQPVLDFIGPGVGVRDASGRTEVIISGTSTGSGSLPNTEVGFGNGSSITSSNRFTYNTATDSLTIGNTSPYTSALLSVFGDDVVGNYPYLDIFGLGTGYVPTLETYHARGTYAVRQPALANEQLSALDFYGYATGSGNYWLRGVSLEVFAQYDWHVVGGNSYSPAFLRLSAGSTGTSGLTVIGTFDVEKVKLSGDLNVSGTMRPGSFQLRNGATNGYVLTSDANGNATWQAGTPGPAGAGSAIAVFDNSVFKVSGTSVSFDTGLTVAVTGSVAYINATATTGSSSIGFFDAVSYGALIDGSTDDSSAWQAAINAAAVNGGIVYSSINGNSRIGTGLSYTALKRLSVIGYGVTLKPDAGITCITINQSDVSGTSTQASVHGLTIDGTNKSNNAIGFLLRNSDYPLVIDCRIINCGTGVLVSNSAGLWTEGSTLENTIIAWCTTGLSYSGAGSYAQANLRNVGINNCDTGLSVGSGLTLNRSNFQGVTIWCYAGQTGVYINGDPSDSLWHVNLETFSASGTIAISIGSSATNTEKFTWYASFVGTWGTKVSIAASKKLLLNESGQIHEYLGSGASSVGIFPTYSQADTEPRLRFGNNFPGGGGIEFGPGGSTAPDGNIYRKAALTVGTDKVFFVGSYTTAGRPSAVTCGAGAILYNSTTSLLQVSNGSAWVDVGSGGTTTSNPLLVYDNSVFRVSGTAISFDDNLTVAVTGTVAYIAGQASAPGSSSPLLVYEDSVFRTSGTAISFNSNLNVSVSGSVAFVDAVGSGIGGSTVLSGNPTSVCQGRLTLESGVPISTSDQTGKATVYFTPYQGNLIGLCSGTSWSVYSFAERSLSIAAFTASKPYDIFCYGVTGSVVMEGLVWTNTTGRATALTLQDGILVKSGDTSRRYVGTIYVNSSGGQTDDSETRRCVWNYYNRAPRRLYKSDANTHNYTTTTDRYWNNDANMKVEYVCGYVEDAMTFNLQVVMNNNAEYVGCDIDSAATIDRTLFPFCGSTVAWISSSGFSSLEVLGYHYVSILEHGATSATFYEAYFSSVFWG